MSKNTSSNAFRRIDVDQYAEDNYKEEVDNDSVAAGPNETDVMALLAQNKQAEALKHVLSNAPLGSNNQAVRDASFSLVLRVLLSFKTSQIDEAVKQLDNETRDILMKYIYRGFEVPSEGSSIQLLVWHEKVFALSGVGSIVRVLTDKKKV
ncbi:actin-related protein 2/3 complex subunit 5 [Eurytemora carolleeae]|uniref:actin-related protein 2/3 complex subunit 5 n=1 Tax=Eurytemora carolleeae TaxID=1294199 RepID=UPI000C794359|nr:actin-related protein 2/3 complex subunit 5 [Eurytemora carolleeae]XP_023329931.1 actin-related protein 2/3 complex subunit 5 [Eurytemora carolleeae]|eukprot:XP_023329922.1 actin-related protein 2/3 complex subunit 5-like [Eurytemora affinis]